MTKISMLLHLVNVRRPDVASRTGFRVKVSGPFRLGAFFTLLLIAAVTVTAFYAPRSSASSKRAKSLSVDQSRASTTARTPEKAGDIRHKDNSRLLSWANLGVVRRPILVAFPQQVSAFATYADDCTTPKTDFNFNETVCVKITGVPPGLLRFQWSNPYDFLARETFITSSTQTDTFLITPSTTFAGGPITNRGTWRISATDFDAIPIAVAYVTFHDPATPTADLGVYKALKSASQVNENSDVDFSITVANKGPDAAKDVHLVDVTPNVATFVSLSQDTGGPTFTCSNSNCTIASLPKGAKANFTARYHTNGVSSTTLGTYSASVSSDPSVGAPTAELRPEDNTADGEFIVNTTGTATDCTLDCPDNINATANTTESNVRGAHVSFPAATPSGDCGAVTATPASGSFFPVGATTVTVTSATGGGSCSFVITVTDTGFTPPTISCPANQVVNANSSCEASVSLGAPSTTGDNVTVVGTRSDGKPMFNCDANGNNCTRRSPDDPFSAGTTTITWTAYSHDVPGPFPISDDEEAHRKGSASCTQTITVVDVTPPVISAATQTASADASCQAAVPDFTATATVSDNCACSGSDTSDSCADRHPITVTQDPAPGTLVGLGPHTITLTANDGSSNNNGDGNTAITTTTFTVNDTTAPVITIIGASSVTVECHTSFSDPGATAADNCDSSVPVTVTGTVDVNTPGTYTLTYHAADDSGNAATATRTVTVVDTIKPVITLNGASSVTVECHTSYSDAGATAADTCDTSVPVTVSGSVNVNTVGTYTLSYNAADDSGNTAVTVTRTVNVVDTTAPTITLNGQTVSMWPPNHRYQTFQVTNFVTSVSDSCNTTLGVNDVVIEKVTSDEMENSGGDGNTVSDIVIAANCKSLQLRAERNGGGDGRVYTITFRLRDASGNTTRATAKVVVPHNNGSPAVDSGIAYTVTSSCP